MEFLLKTSFTGMILAMLLASTVWPNDRTDQAGVEFFEKHIRPLLAQHCYQCHSERTGEREGGLLLDHRDGWIRGGDSGRSVVPGDVEASLLIRAVRYADEDLQMPPVKPLPEEAVARLEQWVRIGAPGPLENAPGTVDDPSDPIAGKRHWAFQPLTRPEVPKVEDPAWPRTGIDRFVLAGLESEGLQPAPDADRRDLLRRVYFQLTGLPPTTGQVNVFLADERPDAFEQLVDGLLSSPHFGERWGRHWLDLARYADSNGLDENFLFREAWRYRNWVIAAVNADVPFDRFILQQISGDRLPFDTIEQRDRQRIAAGFLVVGPKVLLGNDEARQRMEVADEQIDTIGRAILGQTLGCARCHDHKFDPFPTADYYALAGILTSTQVMEKRYMLGQQRVMERLVGLGGSGEDADGAYEKYWLEHPDLKQRSQRARSVLESIKTGDEAAVAQLWETSPDAFADGASDLARTKAERAAAQEELVARLERLLAEPPPIPPRAMVPIDAEQPSDEHIRLAGQFDSLGDKVSRGFLQVLCDDAAVADAISAEQSGRVALGRWLTEREGRAGQLTARVLANRVWRHLMGRGLVRTVDNFGRTGEPPSHPELLDFLASELLDANWSLKTLVRQITLSRTFALSSRHDAAADSSDPENRLLWRAHRRRLDPEMLRDAMLFIAGELDLKPMQSTVWYLNDQATAVGDNKVRRRTDFPSRSVYLPVIRNDLPELFEVFDFANPHTTTGARPKTTVPTQGLYMLNDETVMDAASATARRVSAEARSDSVEARVDRLFELTLGVFPTENEKQALVAFLRQTESRLASEGEQEPEQRALAIACHAVFASSRFQYLE